MKPEELENSAMAEMKRTLRERMIRAAGVLSREGDKFAPHSALMLEALTALDSAQQRIVELEKVAWLVANANVTEANALATFLLIQPVAKDVLLQAREQKEKR